MGEENSIITFESLYDTARNEKTKEEIINVNPNIYSQIINYLKSKTEIYKNAKNDPNYNPAELEKIKTQILNARKLIKEWYEKREWRVLKLAFNKSRVKNVDESALLKEERLYLEEVTKIMDKYRDGILLHLINLRSPFTEKIEQQIKAAEEEIKTEEKQEVKENIDDSKIEIKLLEDIPKFVGTNLEIYGPFKTGETAILPKELADVLLKREKAEKII